MMQKVLLMGMIFLALFAFSAQAVEDGENVFQKTFSMPKVDFPGGIPFTCWDAKVLPDFNENGKNEIFIAADDDSKGAWYFVVEADANNSYKVLWYYFIKDCNYSYVLANTTVDEDLDGDGLPELLIGVDQDAGTGLPGVWIFEKDTTIVDAYPFSMDAPTCTYDVNNNGGAVTCIFAANLDNDPNVELVMGEANDDIVYVVEETGGDLSFPIFELEYADTLEATPWGYFCVDLDNDGQKDWGVGSSRYNSVRFYECAGEEDKYTMHQDLKLDDDVDGYCLRGMGTRDINGDGRTEVIYVRYTAPGKVFIVTNPGETALIDSTHVYQVFVEPNSKRLVGVAYADMDHGFASDGPDIYFADRDNNNIYDLEYTGPVGEKVDATELFKPENWDVYTLYTGAQRMQQVVASDFDRDGEGEIGVIYAGGTATFLEVIEHVPLPDAGFKVAWHDSPDTNLCVDPVWSNPRGIYAGSDVDKDGKPEVMCTEYEGKIHVYEVVADNTLEWVWSYNYPTAPSSGSSPRDIKVGDVDGNGREEIIVCMGATAAGVTAHPDSVGFYFFEWDGQTDNGFGMNTTMNKCGTLRSDPTYILPVKEIDPRLTACNATEAIYVDDVDGDGDQEVFFPSDASGTGGDGLYIFSCTEGELTGFPTWLVEVKKHRGSGEVTGSPKCATTGDLNGNGKKEVIFASWNNGQLNIFEAVAPNTYEETEIFTDITLTDETIYKGIGTIDLDGNGDDELIFNSYWNATIYIINAPDSIKNIDVNNPEHYAWLRADAGGSGLTGALGDQDQDGLPEFYVTLYARGGVRSLEYNGGGSDFMKEENWTMQEVYVDRDFVYGDKYVKGVVSAVHGSFGVFAPKVDLDKDGYKEVVVTNIESPYSKTWLYVFESTQMGTGVENEVWSIITPNDYKLSQNYPNPFNATSIIKYYIALDKNVTIRIYNSLGQVVKTLVDNKFLNKGSHEVTWDGTNQNGIQVSSGTYIYSLEIGNQFKLTKQMTLMK